MRFFLFLFLGIFAGLYISWPGLLIPGNWKCFNEIIAKSAEDKISFKAALKISPSYLQKAKNKKRLQKKESQQMRVFVIMLLDEILILNNE